MDNQPEPVDNLGKLRDQIRAIADELEDDEASEIEPNVPLLIAALRAAIAD